MKHIPKKLAVVAVSALILGAWTQVPTPPPSTASPQGPATGAAPGPGRSGGRGGAPVRSPEVGADQRITFRLRAPNAKEVIVTIASKRLSMEKDQGVWSVTTDPLSPELYTIPSSSMARPSLIQGAASTRPHGGRDRRLALVGRVEAKPDGVYTAALSVRCRLTIASRVGRT